MNSNWKECKLGDVVELVGGGTPKTTVLDYWNGDIPWLSVVDFNTGNKYVYNTAKTITKKGLENSSTKLLNEGDIIISARGTVGALAVLKKKMAFNQSCYGIRNITDISDRDYLYYLTKDSINNFQQIAHGGVFDTITRETFDQIDIILPPLPEQRSIAGVLSSLDDKIDLLHRQNKTLEGMAEALWRKMFVPACAGEPHADREEADPRWKKGKLGNLVELCYGKGLKEEKRIPGKYPVVGSSGIVGYHNNFLVNGPGIVIGRKGTLGVVNYIEENFFPIDTTYFIKSKTNSGRLFFEYFLLKEFSFEEMNSDSAVPGLNREIAESMEFLVPEIESIYKFNDSCEPLFTKKMKNGNQIRTLSRLRETLLPKLMSGEARVKTEEIV